MKKWVSGITVMIVICVLVAAIPIMGRTLSINQSSKLIAPNVSAENIANEIARQKEVVGLMRDTVPVDRVFSGWHFVVDVGHGDNDSGAIRKAFRPNGQDIIYAESTMTLDIARRLGWYLKHRGASGVYFSMAPQEVVSLDALDEYSFWHPFHPPVPLRKLTPILPPHPNAITYDERALTARSQVANQKVGTYGKQWVIYLSIHIDSLSPKVSGISFYQARGGKSQLIYSLKQAAIYNDLARKREGHIGSYYPINQANFVVIDKKYNNAGEALLIETANIHNGDFDKGDFSLIIRAEGREEIAQTLGQGLQMFCEKYRPNK